MIDDDDDFAPISVEAQLIVGPSGAFVLQAKGRKGGLFKGTHGGDESGGAICTHRRVPPGRRAILIF